MRNKILEYIKYTILLIFCFLFSGCDLKDSLTKTKETITFKSIPLGKENSIEKLREICLSHESNIPKYEFEDSKKCDFTSKRNLIWINYGNLNRSLAWITINDSGSLEEVEIEADKLSMLELANLLEEQYGPAQKSTEPVKNKLGQDFEQKKFTWTDSSGNQIKIWSIFETVNEGRLVIKSANRIAAEKEIEKRVHEVNKSRL